MMIFWFVLNLFLTSFLCFSSKVCVFSSFLFFLLFQCFYYLTVSPHVSLFLFSSVSLLTVPLLVFLFLLSSVSLLVSLFFFSAQFLLSSHCISFRLTFLVSLFLFLLFLFLLFFSSIHCFSSRLTVSLIVSLFSPLVSLLVSSSHCFSSLPCAFLLDSLSLSHQSLIPPRLSPYRTLFFHPLLFSHLPAPLSSILSFRVSFFSPFSNLIPDNLLLKIQTDQYFALPNQKISACL